MRCWAIGLSLSSLLLSSAVAAEPASRERKASRARPAKRASSDQPAARPHIRNARKRKSDHSDRLLRGVRGTAAPVRRARRPVVRTGGVGLGTRVRSSLAAPVADTRAEIAKSEETIAVAADRAEVKSRAKTAFETTVDALRAHTAAARPRARGRIKLDFKVDRRGRAVDVYVIGFDASLDEELTRVIEAQRFPASYAGRYLTTSIYIQPPKGGKASVGKANTSRTKRRRRPRRR